MFGLLSGTVEKKFCTALFTLLALGACNSSESRASPAVIPIEFRGKWIMPNGDKRDIKDLICDDDVADKNILTITGSGLREDGKAFGEIDFLCKIAKVTVDKRDSTKQTVVVKQACTFYEGAIVGARPVKRLATETWRLTDVDGELFMLRDRDRYRKCR